MLRQLILKELRLQRSAGIMLLIMLACCALLLGVFPWKDARVMQVGSHASYGELAFGLGLFFGWFLIPIVIPLVIGANAVAEERSLAMLDWQLSLPCSRSLQWFLKLGVGAALCLGLALFPPLLTGLFRSALGPFTDQPDRVRRFLELGLQNYVFVVSFLALACSALISTFMRRSYHAFFGGIALIALLIYCIPNDMAAYFASAVATIGTYFEVIYIYAVLYLVFIALLLVLIGRLNFRFDALRKLPAVGLILLSVGVTTCVISLGLLYPAPFVWLTTSDADFARGRVLRQRDAQGDSAPLPSNVHPLLAFRPEATADGSNWMTNGNLSLMRLPESDDLLLPYFPTRLNIHTGALRPFRGACGMIDLLSPQGDQIKIERSIFGAAPWPVTEGGIAHRLGLHRELTPSIPVESGWRREIKHLDGRLFQQSRSNTRMLSVSTAQVTSGPLRLLVQEKAPWEWKSIEAVQSEHGYFQVSSDEAWSMFCVTKLEGASTESLTIRSLHDAREFKLTYPGVESHLRLRFVDMNDLSANRMLGWHGTPASHDGRYLVYSGKFLVQPGIEAYADYLCIFDTVLGKESRMPLPELSAASDHEGFPIVRTAWAPSSAHLAVRRMDTLLILEAGPEGLRTIQTLDLRGYEIFSHAFWDDQTLIAWGGVGIFRIDL